jgi:hypothetical protein
MVRLQKLVSEALDVLRSTGYRLDSQLTLAMKAVARAEAITSALLPGADASVFARLGGDALEELVPEAVETHDVRESARRSAFAAGGELAQRLPAMRGAAGRWLDQLEKGESPVSVRLADLDDERTYVESIRRLIAASIVLTGLLIGSALAASLDTQVSVFRRDVADIAGALFLASAALAIALAAPLLWRLVRPQR